MWAGWTVKTNVIRARAPVQWTGWTEYLSAGRTASRSRRWNASGFESTGKLKWRLTTILHDNSFWLLFSNDFKHIFKSYWFEV